MPKFGDSNRKAQRALEESAAYRRALLDSSLDCIICTDGKARITDFNLAAERTFRVDQKTIIGRDFGETLLPADRRDRFLREMFSPVTSAHVEVIGNRMEGTAIRSDGYEFPAEFTVTAIPLKEKAYVVHVRDITARKRAEEAITRMAAIVESSQDAIIGTDLNGKIRSWNRAAELMVGYTAAEATGQDMCFLVPHSRDLPQQKPEPKLGAGVRTFETVRVAKTGELRDVSISLSQIHDLDGTLIGASAIIRDITAQTFVQEALRKANETSIYGSPVPTIAADVRGRVSMWNQAAEKVFGWTEREILGRRIPIIPDEEKKTAATLHRRLLSGETITGMEVRRRKRDGEQIVVSLSASPLWDEHHKVRGIIGFLTDITQLKRAEEVLRRAEEKYRGIFENVLEGIYQASPDGKYLSANPALARMLGFESAEELVRAQNDITNQGYVTPHSSSEFLRELQKRGEVQGFEYEAYRKDGKPIWISVSAHAVRDTQGKILYLEGTVQDVTQSRELELQLRQMQKIEAIGRLAGGVAHDFNNILMAISSYTELLQRNTPSETQSRYLREIERATTRGSSLTQGLLTFSRKQVSSPKLLELNSVIAQQIDMLRRLIPENVELRFVPGSDIGRIRADLSQIEQVIMNLVINSRDAMPEGGEILITTSNAGSDGRVVAIMVRDTGCGMDAETQSHIFEPFFTTKEQGKGTGLGLATVFGIVNQSGGQISVESAPGKGTTFNLRFPRLENEAETVCTTEPGVSITGTETILLAEDDVAVREPTAEYLLQNGYTVLKAGDGSEALEIARSHTQAIHLLLTDLVMPRMSGRALADELIAIHPEAEIIFMSGYSRNLLSDQQVLDGKHTLLHKPFSLTTLTKQIRKALNRTKATAAS